MVTKVIALCLAVTVLSAAMPVVGQTAPRTGSWDLVKGLPRGDDLEVKLKSGETRTGVLFNATDQTLSLLEDNRVIDLDRQQIAKVYRFSRKRTKSLSGIGGLAGLFTGLAVTLSVGMREGSNRGAQKVVAGSAIPVGVVVGSISGHLIGKRMARKLIYEE